MATKALFLSPDDTLLVSYIEDNYDKDQVAAVIYNVQQLYLVDLIGSGLYNELETQQNSNSLTSLNQTLISKMKDVLIMYVLSEGMMVFNYKIRNKGVMQMNSDNAQSVQVDVLMKLIQKFKDNAQVYAQRLTNYLSENQSNYPLFNNPGSAIDTIYPKRNSYNTGFYLGPDYSDISDHLDAPST